MLINKKLQIRWQKWRLIHQIKLPNNLKPRPKPWQVTTRHLIPQKTRRQIKRLLTACLTPNLQIRPPPRTLHLVLPRPKPLKSSQPLQSLPFFPEKLQWKLSKKSRILKKTNKTRRQTFKRNKRHLLRSNQLCKNRKLMRQRKLWLRLRLRQRLRQRLHPP